MAGWIRDRGAGYEVRVYMGVDPFTGKKRYKTKVCRTKAEANKVLKGLIAQSLKPSTSDHTFGELVVEWLAISDLSPTTRSAYDAYLSAYILPVFGTTKLDKVSASKIDQFYLALRQRGLAPATVHKAHVIIHRVLQQGVKYRWINENAADFVSVPSIPRHTITPPSPAEVGALIDLATKKDKDYGCFLRVAASSGARRGELCGLHWSDVNLTMGAIVISKSVVLGGKKKPPVERGTKTGNSRRVVLDGDTVDILRLHHQRALDRAGQFGTFLPSTAYVFSHEPDGSKPWRPDNVTTKFMALRNQMGLEVRLHDLRHFVATQALAANIPARNVAGRLGHARTSMTTDVYADWVPQSDDDTAKTMGDILRPAQPRTPQPQSEAPSADAQAS